MKPNIVFFVDHKYRDMMSLSKIAYSLRKKNNIFFLSNLHFNLISLFDYAILLKPQLPDNLVKEINDNIIKTKIFIIPSEGMLQDDGVAIPSFLPYCWFHWSDYEKNKYRKYEIEKNVEMKSLGCQRIEFITDKKSRDMILDFYKFEELKNKKITIASSLHECFFDKDTLRKKKERLKKHYSKSLDYDLYVKNSNLLLERLTKNLIILCKKYKNYKFILRPHPNEKIDFWIDFKNKLNSKNFDLDLGSNIVNLITSSSLHISLNGCTTTVEAKLANIPTLELHTIYSEKLYHGDHLNIADYISYTESDILVPFNDMQKNKLINKKINHLYLKKYFNNALSLNTKKYSEEIQKRLIPIQNNKISRLFNLFKINLVLNKYKFFDILKVIKFSNKNQNIGKFDHRIKFNEHKIFFRFFNKHNLDRN